MKEALIFTANTIDLRAFRFKNFVIAIVINSLTSIVWATIQKSWLSLLGILLILPFSGIFLYLDTRRVSQWQQQILEMWIQETLDFDIFSKTILTIRMLPKHTLEGMLDTLPKSKNAKGKKISTDTRKALAMTLQTISNCQSDRTAFFTLAVTVGLLSLVFVLLLWSWEPLLNLFFIVPVIAMGKLLAHYRLEKWRRQIVRILKQNEQNLKDFVEIVVQLDWESVSDQKKERLLKSLKGLDTF